MRDTTGLLRAARPRWRVGILGGTPSARAHLSVAICSAGGVVALEHESPEEAVRSVARPRADAVRVTPASHQPGGGILARLRDEPRCRVVLLARGPSGRLVDLAREAG